MNIKKFTMKGIMFSIFIIFFFFTNPSVFSYSYIGIDGQSRSMETFAGKGLMIVTLPCQQSLENDSFLYSLDTLEISHRSNLYILGVPSFEDGFTTTNRESLKNWYRSKLNDSIRIADGIFSRKSSGLQQSDVFKWLTTDSLNGTFNIDISGPNHKFFIEPDGSLFAVIVPETSISSRTVNRVVRQLSN